MNPISIALTSLLLILYVWILYHLPILAVGVRHLRETNTKRTPAKKASRNRLPVFSIIVPVKDEEQVVGRLLQAFLKVDYPFEKKEIIIVEDGSHDKTVEICREFAERYPGQVRLVCRSVSDGKPSALNCGLSQSKGEIVAVFDADNIPTSDVLLRAAEYFEDPEVACIQGNMCLVNADESMLTKLTSYEESVRFGVYFSSKDILGLFVPISGSCYFARRSVVDEVGGWDSQSLSEDMEMAAKLTKNGYKTRFASEVMSRQESPSNFKQFVRQRLRWFRGCMEVALRYGRLVVEKPGLRSVDAEMTLFGLFMLPLCFISYVLALYAWLSGVKLDALSMIFVYGVPVLSLLGLSVIGVAVALLTRPRRKSNLLWLVFIYAYWFLQILLAFFAFFQILSRRQRKWLKTMKSGVVSNKALEY